MRGALDSYKLSYLDVKKFYSIFTIKGDPSQKNMTIFAPNDIPYLVEKFCFKKSLMWYLPKKIQIHRVKIRLFMGRFKKNHDFDLKSF